MNGHPKFTTCTSKLFSLVLGKGVTEKHPKKKAIVYHDYNLRLIPCSLSASEQAYVVAQTSAATPQAPN